MVQYEFSLDQHCNFFPTFFSSWESSFSIMCCFVGQKQLIFVSLVIITVDLKAQHKLKKHHISSNLREEMLRKPNRNCLYSVVFSDFAAF